MDGSGIKVYSYRWVVLGAFAFINLTIQILWICYAAVTGPAARYYGVSDMKIGFLAMVFMIVFIPAAIPASFLIDRFGFRKGVGLGAVLLGVFGLLRGIFPANYNAVLAFTIGIALAQPLLLNSFTTLASKWFPFEHRAMVSGLALAASFVGMVVALMLTPWMTTRYGFDSMQLIYGLVTAGSALVFLVLVREAPPTPPSPEGFTERALMFDGLKLIARMRDFWFCMLIFFVGVGVFNGIVTWIEDIARPRGLGPQQAGMLGGTLLIGGIVGAALIPALSDHYRRRKPFILIGMIGALPGLLGFTYFNSYLLLLASVFVIGFFMIGLGPIGYQYGAEITYPAPEGTSNGLLVLAGQVSVVFIFAMQYMNERYGSFTPSLLAATGLVAINCAIVSRMKESKLIEQIGKKEN